VTNAYILTFTNVQGEPKSRNFWRKQTNYLEILISATLLSSSKVAL
jgi:hypothetical protein